MRDDRDRLADILNATERILERAPEERIDVPALRKVVERLLSIET